MKTLVTGANGHIGCNVVREVLRAGWTPVAFVRQGSDLRGLAGLEVEQRVGDLLEPDSVQRAMQGIDLLMHVGAVHRNFDADPTRIERAAVEGTRNALAAARAAGVKRVVYTSSGATVGFAKDPAHPLDETHFLQNPCSAYIRGKVLAEQHARKEAARGDEPQIVILNPSGVVGPRDYRITPATRAVVGLLQGDPAFLHMCITDVRDVAHAHVLAAQRGQPGQRYLVTGEIQSPAQIAAALKQVAGVKPPQLRPPMFLLRLLGRSFRRKALRDGSDPPFDVDALQDVAGGQLTYDSSRSRTELGMSYRTTQQVLTDTVRWLLHVQALKPAVARKLRAHLGALAAPDADWNA